ncbi:MAG: hypothetical protein JWO32_1265 [Bacteroidetes bacterium]|nr:hypothetical protein [Bacteroidota bacterium]
MKKILLIAAVAGLAMVSCKKDRVCTCTSTSTTTYNGVSTSGTYTQDVNLVKVSKRTAKLACIHTKSTYSNSNSTTVDETDCKLK